MLSTIGYVGAGIVASSALNRSDVTRLGGQCWHQAPTRNDVSGRAPHRYCPAAVVLSCCSKSEHGGWAERGILGSVPVGYDAPTPKERIVIPVLPTIGWILIVVGVIVLILGLIPQVGLSGRGPYGWGGGLLLIIVGVVLLFIPA